MSLYNPLARVKDIAGRTGEVIEEAEDVALAETLIMLVSAQVRHYGLNWQNRILAPEIAVATVIEAASRGYMNPAGYGLERGNQMTLERQDVFAAGSILTAEEIKAVRTVAGKVGLQSVLFQRDVTVSDQVNQSDAAL